MSATTREAWEDICPAPELIWDEETAQAARALILRAVPESKTQCLCQPGQPCNLLGYALKGLDAQIAEREKAHA